MAAGALSAEIGPGRADQIEYRGCQAGGADGRKGQVKDPREWQGLLWTSRNTLQLQELTAARLRSVLPHQNEGQVVPGILIFEKKSNTRGFVLFFDVNSSVWRLCRSPEDPPSTSSARVWVGCPGGESPLKN